MRCYNECPPPSLWGQQLPVTLLGLTTTLYSLYMFVHRPTDPSSIDSKAIATTSMPCYATKSSCLSLSRCVADFIMLKLKPAKSTTTAIGQFGTRSTVTELTRHTVEEQLNGVQFNYYYWYRTTYSSTLTLTYD